MPADRQTTLLEADSDGGVMPVVAPQAAPLAIQDSGSVSLFERLAKDPNVDVDKLERLMQMNERALARQAEFLFNEAMAAAQKEMKAVVADSYNNQTRSRYASYEALDEAVRPIYTSHGFGLSFDSGEGAPAEFVRMLCYVTHAGGHSRTYKLDMPADGKGAKGGDVMTKTHAVGSAASYGQRYLLKMIFNIAIKDGTDDDGNTAAGKPPAPPKPKGYDTWLEGLKATAAKGLKAFEPAWECSDGEFKTYAMNHERELVVTLKKTAAAASRGMK